MSLLGLIDLDFYYMKLLRRIKKHNREFHLIFTFDILFSHSTGAFHNVWPLTLSLLLVDSYLHNCWLSDSQAEPRLCLYCFLSHLNYSSERGLSFTKVLVDTWIALTGYEETGISSERCRC